VCSPDERQSIAGIGIGAAGPVDFRTGEVIKPPNLGFPRIPLVAPLHEAFDLPIFLINDCHAGMLGEACSGAARGRDCVLYLTLSTGIGGAFLEQGRMLLGHAGNALEIGHLTVDDRYAVRCGCGHTGHWEGYASGKHIPGFFRQWCKHHDICIPPFNVATPEKIFSAARRRDPTAMQFVEELGRINARAISDLVVAFDPELFILDGPVMLRNSDLLLPPLKKYSDRFLPFPEITVSPLDGLAPLLGAAVIARGYDTPFGSFTRFCTRK
jgi:glucokinase